MLTVNHASGSPNILLFAVPYTVFIEAVGAVLGYAPPAAVSDPVINKDPVIVREPEILISE